METATTTAAGALRLSRQKAANGYGTKNPATGGAQTARRWTHLIRFAPGQDGRPHTGYATYRPGNTSQPDALLSVGDNVHAPGQIVAVLNMRGPSGARWETKGGERLDVLVRPQKGQPATPETPHRVTVWQVEGEGDERLCIPWVRYEGPDGNLKWDPAPFRPTCDEVAAKIEASARNRRRGKSV